ncbi:glycoside hydrolase domain-containing protein [Litchfieldia salsa]|uniref:Rv2525c-like glycoside hydrolase-like domain-containing protein n=1 Tax=Litchfieldia salsa TaxID=930152 RepID=A0A1H0RLR6_9BACI|nr:glycoside hydrolase domain-containing protein [Litchfieldia salsa]SDP30395.1 protein of unknown function [Litchfieldia salsa]
MPRYLWGVDSVATVTEEFYSCVKSNYGTPKYWGRYLTEVPNVSEGLTRKEITFIHNKGMKVLPIYNVLTEAIGYANGQLSARNAVYNARRLGIPDHIALFADIEGFLNVDEAWIRGWVESLYPTGYRPGIYHDPVEGDFARSYCEAVSKNKQIAIQSILWCTDPHLGVSKEKNAPKYKPTSPKCKSNVWVWQYGRDAPDCPVDTNLIDQRGFNYLY